MVLWSSLGPSTFPTEDCHLQNRNATDKLNQQCSKLALFANTVTEIQC